jgi:hypothetical protein
MAKTRGTGLLMVWTDVDPEHEAEFNRFYDEEHMAHLAKVPGFLSCGRYMAVRGSPKYLALYELEEPNVLYTAAFLDTVRYKPWYNTCYIPGYLAVPGCLRARRFVAVDGVPKYLTVYEFEHAGVPDSAAWDKARHGNPWSARMRPHVQLDQGSPSVLKRIYPDPVR